jgi:hypothetical protein
MNTMDIDLSERTQGFLKAFLLMILPLIALLLGMVLVIENIWYYLLAITWFGSGMIFYGALTE